MEAGTTLAAFHTRSTFAQGQCGDAGRPFLVLIKDFRAERTRRLAEERRGLTAEAQTLVVTIRQIWHHGNSAIQDQIDAVCHRVRQMGSGGHHIAAVVAGQAVPDHMGCPDLHLLATMNAATLAPDGQAYASGERMLAAAAHDRDVRVYVAEPVSPILHAMERTLFGRSAWLAAVGLLPSAILTVILLLLVTRLVETVRRIAAGDLSGRLPVDSAVLTSTSLAPKSTRWADRLPPPSDPVT